MKKQILQRNNITPVILGLSAIILVFTGCRKKEALVPVPAPVKPNVPAGNPAAKAVQKNVSTVSALPTPVGNQFDFSNKKDPFKPDIAIKNIAALKGNESSKGNINILPIHSFDVSQFRLIGIITGSKENQAMVVDPNGKGYVLKPGMTIGKNDGKITTISASGVDVLEQFKDDNGRLRKENIRLTLPKKQ